MLDIEVATADPARLRRATPDELSLALMDARNHTLRSIAACEAALGGPALKVPRLPEIDPPLWTLGHIAWFQEHWIARNLRRQRGEHGGTTGPVLASILPEADRCFDAALVPHAARWSAPLPDLQTLRQYAMDTLESTLDLLAGTPTDDDALYFYRLALFREDQTAEAMAALAQLVGFDAGLRPRPAAFAPRPPLLFPATQWVLGGATAGFTWANERGARAVALPEFEIDAQAVTWAQYAEFVEDGGYDDPRHWGTTGWAWVQAQGRRTPRFVDQMRQGVLQQRFGKLVRVPMTHPAVHISWHEADAWCRWAGRRLPSEVEWEAAAFQGASRGMRWGEVWEWTANTFRLYEGNPTVAAPAPPFDESCAGLGQAKVLRGASWATRDRLRFAKVRRARPAEHDHGFCGFRSCAP